MEPKFTTKIAKKNIKAIMFMTHNEKGELVPAENMYRIMYNGLLQPIFFKVNGRLEQGYKPYDYTAAYIENKISFNVPILPDLHKGFDVYHDGQLIAEYRNDIHLYWITIEKGTHYEQSERGEILIYFPYKLGDAYEFPKRFWNLKTGDEVWFCRYYRGDFRDDYKNRGFQIPLQKFKVTVEDRELKDNNYYQTIPVQIESSFHHYLNAYSRISVESSNSHIEVTALDKKDVAPVFKKEFEEAIKCYKKKIKDCEEHIEMYTELIETISNA